MFGVRLAAVVVILLCSIAHAVHDSDFVTGSSQAYGQLCRRTDHSYVQQQTTAANHHGRTSSNSCGKAHVTDLWQQVHVGLELLCVRCGLLPVLVSHDISGWVTTATGHEIHIYSATGMMPHTQKA